MIGSMVTITARKKLGGGVTYFGFPLAFALLLLLPLAILTSPLFLVACLLLLINPGRVVSVFWGILRASRGTEIQVEDRGRIVGIDIHSVDDRKRMLAINIH
jgi:hypothetical protein